MYFVLQQEKCTGSGGSLVNNETECDAMQTAGGDGANVTITCDINGKWCIERSAAEAIGTYWALWIVGSLCILVCNCSMIKRRHC